MLLDIFFLFGEVIWEILDIGFNMMWMGIVNFFIVDLLFGDYIVMVYLMV